MPETVIGVLENVQTKPPGSLTVKSCDLVFTDRRMLCLKVGGSSLVAGMLGSAVGGAGGAIAFGRDNLAAQESSRKAMDGRGLDDILRTDEENYAIEHSVVEKGSFKTGFLSSMGLMSPFTIHAGGRRYFYNVYNRSKEQVKALIRATMPNVKVS
ncbi:MAG: hypothetical protein NWE88_02175 [Candidatus Bathyarchaeota archaeon]|nr:hypothetical protein [Candidatus Bathyarchaeota archaeon]